MNKIKVLLLYVIYPLAMASYFRKALEHREDVDLKVVGPYTGSFIPWLGGINLPEKYARPPDIPVPMGNRVHYGVVRQQLGEWQPDLVLTVDAGINWSHKPTDGIVATVATDPHVLDYQHARKISDKMFNMQAAYSDPSDIYLPYAYSQYDHYPTDGTVGVQPNDRDWKNPPEIVEYVRKDTDCVLIGMPYPNRVDWVNRLRGKRLSVIFENGPVYDEARELYNRGRIGLNWSSLNDLNARAFELPAMKLYPVMNRVPDMGRFPTIFDNCGIFENNLNDAVEKVMWAVEHPVDAAQKAELAYQAVQNETYDARVQTILKVCGLL